MPYYKTLIMSLFFVTHGIAMAAPDLTQKVGLTIADTGSTQYRFEKISFTSNDQERHYQINIAIPKAPAPANGYPVLYMLDGNAALAALNDQRLNRLQDADSPVIVTLGYDTDLYFDVVARAYDYTPALIEKNLDNGRKYGGAELFWQLIEQQIKPQVAQKVKLDLDRQALWGHSFAGLFVLHTLFNHPESFQTYIAVDPSLWWQQGLILNAEQPYQQRSQRPQAQVLIQQSSSRRKGDTLPENAMRHLAQRLSHLPELEVQYHEYFKHTHGSLLAASIPAALRMTQGIIY